MMNRYVSVATLLAMTTVFSACSGKNSGSQFLKDMDVSISQIGPDSYINLKASVDLGSVQFDSASISVVDPQTGNPVGSVSFSDSNGTGVIGLQVNADLLTHGDATLGSTLPNGSPLPLLLNLTPGESLGVNAGSSTRIYLGGDLKTKILAGVAVAIPGLSSATSGISFPANVFFSVPFGTSITGVAGLYTSPTAQDNGVAVFGEYVVPAPAPVANAKVSTILNNPNFESAQNHDYSSYDAMGKKNQNKLMNFFYGKKHKVHVK